MHKRNMLAVCGLNGATVSCQKTGAETGNSKAKHH
jgi:hypothetical protein